MKKAFTLIELIGVVTLLGILALLAFPPILNMIRNTEGELSSATKEIIFQASNVYLNENSNLYPKMANTTYCLTINELVQNDLLTELVTTSKTDKISLDTKIKVYVDNESRYTFEINNDCVTNINPNIVVKNKNGVFNSLGWAKEAFYVSISTTGSSYRYCIDNKQCTPNTTIEDKIGSVYINQNRENNYVCAQGISGTAVSDVVCVGPYKLDSVIPVLTFKDEDTAVTLGASVLVSSLFNTPTYGISGAESFACTPTNTNSFTLGTKQVECTATSNSSKSITVKKNITVISGKYEFLYSGSHQIFTVPTTGRYKLEVWGAQGGYRSSSTYGGLGGYSTGEVNFIKGTNIYVYVGGSGNTGGVNGGFNGGGIRDTHVGGGGATDMRLVQNDLYSRFIVAGGGGSDGAANRNGGYGGGTTGETRTQTYGSGGGGGSQTAGGAGGNNNSGLFGVGGKGLYYANGYGGAGGGGWYGGGGAYPDGSGDDDRGGGGGSGFVWSSATAGNVPSGYNVPTSYYLTNANTIAGNATMPTQNGSSTMVGNLGNGFAKITYLGK